MHTQSNAREYPSTVLAPEPTPRSPWRVVSLEALPELRLRVTFADGLSGLVDISGLVKSPNAGVFAVLADPEKFAQARIEYGAVAWPGNLDLAPDAMHSEIQKHGIWRL